MKKMKFFLPYRLLFILLLLVEGTLLLPAVRGDICSEDLGTCDDKCKPNCVAKHSGGEGSCANSGGAQVCRCFYECPKRKQCNAGIGTCSLACNEKCCDDNCAAKFPGAMQGHGLCNDIGAERSIITFNWEKRPMLGRFRSMLDNCKSNCPGKHPSGEGSCIESGGTQVSRCCYECPKRKQCNVGIGPFSAAWNAKRCDENYATKFPGAMEGHGLCKEIGAASYYVCTYYC